MLVVSDFVQDGVSLPVWIVFCNVYSFSNEMVCFEVFFPFFG